MKPKRQGAYWFTYLMQERHKEEDIIAIVFLTTSKTIYTYMFLRYQLDVEWFVLLNVIHFGK